MTSEQKVSVEIPTVFLLTLAVFGNMGDGKIPDLMRAWAVSACERAGLDEELAQLRNDRYEELKKRVSKVYGSEMIGSVELMAHTLLGGLKKGNAEA